MAFSLTAPPDSYPIRWNGPYSLSEKVFAMRISGRATAVLTVLLVPVPFAVGADPPGHQVVRVTGPEARRPCEVSVAINPTNPDHVVGVSLQGSRPGEPRTSNHVYVSEDGGQTW